MGVRRTKNFLLSNIQALSNPPPTPDDCLNLLSLLKVIASLVVRWDRHRLLV
jgi:hypothetical protein